MRTVDHVLSLFGFPGGVQVSFRSYYERVRESPTLHHRVFGTFPLSAEYTTVDRYRDLRDSWSARVAFLRDLVSSEVVVHFYNYLCSANVARILTVVPSTRIVMHERGASWNCGASHRRWALRNSDQADVVLTNSEAAKILIAEKWGVPRERTEVIYNGVIPDAAMSLPDPIVTESPEFVVGYIGRLDSPKGVFTLIDAAAKLEGWPDIRYRIVGDGVLREELELYTKELNLEGKVRFVGAVRDPYQAISSFDVLVVPSIREPLGNVAIEAGVLAKPVIASAVDGLPEVLGDAGVLLTPCRDVRRIQTAAALSYPDVVVDPTAETLTSPKELDPEELSEAILDLYEDRERGKRMGVRLARRVRRLFSVETYASALDALYKRLLES